MPSGGTDDESKVSSFRASEGASEPASEERYTRGSGVDTECSELGTDLLPDWLPDWLPAWLADWLADLEVEFGSVSRGFIRDPFSSVAFLRSKLTSQLPSKMTSKSSPRQPTPTKRKARKERLSPLPTHVLRKTR